MKLTLVFIQGVVKNSPHRDGLKGRGGGQE